MEKLRTIFSLIDPMYITPEVRKFLNYTPSKVRHRDHCPACGRNLVNTYKHGEEWLCKRCIDLKKEGKIPCQ